MERSLVAAKLAAIILCGLLWCTPIVLGAGRPPENPVQALSAGWTVDNPAKPLAADAGRVLGLSEIWRISDEGGRFFFKMPRDLQVTDDGTVFLADSKQLLKFSPQGEFLKDLYKQGQGPGEIEDYFSFHVLGRDIYVRDMNSQRLWRSDMDGTFQEQFDLRNKEPRALIGVLASGFLFKKETWPPRSERTGKVMDIPNIVTLVGKDGTDKRAVAAFKTSLFLAPGSATNWDSLLTAISSDGRRLYVFHGRDYLIQVFDLAKGGLAGRFKRDYPRVRYVERGWESGFRQKEYGALKIDYEVDINKLFPVGEALWVETSTLDKTKGRLIDVFDGNGRFTDSFYLGPGRTLMAVGDDCLFSQEKNEDETITIVKYRISPRVSR